MIENVREKTTYYLKEGFNIMYVVNNLYKQRFYDVFLLKFSVGTILKW